MVKSYPTFGYGLLTRLFDNPIGQTGVLEQKKILLTLFSQFLALKIIAPFIFFQGINTKFTTISFLGLTLLILVAIPRFHRAGLLAILIFAFYDFFHSWPFTINHTGLELAILGIICLIPEEKSQNQLSCVAMIKIIMLSVWFFSGIHKLIDGYYINGEFLALEILTNETTLGIRLNNLFSSLTGHRVQFPFACCVHGFFNIPSWQTIFLLGLSWLTIVAEISLPLMFFFVKLRPFALIGLFLAQAFIAYFSGEIDFAFSAFAILFLFIPSLARFLYPLLAIIFLVVQPWA